MQRTGRGDEDNSRWQVGVPGFVKTTEIHTQLGPVFLTCSATSLTAPYLTRSSEQAVKRVVGQETGSQERKMILVTVTTNFTELLLNARDCS